MADNKIGRIAMRTEAEWWVAYYALPDTMKGALELARIKMAFVENPKIREAFLQLIQESIANIVPEFRIADREPAPEHERSGHG